MSKNKLNILKVRAEMLQKVRAFFQKRKILEADVPALTQNAPIDLHIEVMETEVLTKKIGYLHTSPEYGLKRLLAEGLGDLYQLSHVFRFGENGRFHNPEFTLIEWYRENFTYESFLKEVISLLQLFLGKLPIEKNSYRKTFLKYTNLDYTQVSSEELYTFAAKEGLALGPEAKNWDKDTLLNFIMCELIEPKLGQKALFILDEYPSSQAALSQIKMSKGFPVAERFEVYFQGLELANGYHELINASEQRKRLLETNEKRKEANKKVLPIDEKFLLALNRLKDCYGVAVGFDRLLMLKLKQKELKDVLPFAFEET